jgi:TPP-dependent pyruvate/acetoin dehydrogenase alpha subunit
MALASKSKKKTISPAVFYEGAAAGEFHEAMNLQHFGKFLCYLFVKTTYTP